ARAGVGPRREGEVGDVEVAVRDDAVRAPLADEHRGGDVLDLQVHADRLPGNLDELLHVLAETVAARAADRELQRTAILLAHPVRTGLPPGLVEQPLGQILVIRAGLNTGRPHADRVFGKSHFRL